MNILTRNLSHFWYNITYSHFILIMKVLVFDVSFG